MNPTYDRCPARQPQTRDRCVIGAMHAGSHRDRFGTQWNHRSPSQPAALPYEHDSDLRTGEPGEPAQFDPEDLNQEMMEREAADTYLAEYIAERDARAPADTYPGITAAYAAEARRFSYADGSRPGFDFDGASRHDAAGTDTPTPPAALADETGRTAEDYDDERDAQRRHASDYETDR